ncbi:MAG TPA: PQQ-dependent sugar dehydrogenase [Sphingomonas sp.]|jgi:glucose/arabinose dehydrogenase
MAFLPDGHVLVTEKDGRLLLLSADFGTRRELARLRVDSAGQGGLADVAIPRDFAESRSVYLSASVAGPAGKQLVLMRAQLLDGSLRNLKVIHRVQPVVTGDGHYSGKIAFPPDRRFVYLATGDRQKFSPAQDPKGTLGKVLRLTRSGAAVPGNPLAARSFDPAIWSYGHRNVYGLAFDKQGNLWSHEHGPEGGDELNLVLPAQNYGWPNASNGSHYGGGDIPDHRAGDGYEPPKVWWNPSIAPAGLVIYYGRLFGAWRGDALFGGLAGRSLYRVDLNGTGAAKAERWDMGARLREVDAGPDGAVYVLRDGGSGGQMIRLTPK